MKNIPTWSSIWKNIHCKDLFKLTWLRMIGYCTYTVRYTYFGSLQADSSENILNLILEYNVYILIWIHVIHYVETMAMRNAYAGSFFWNYLCIVWLPLRSISRLSIIRVDSLDAANMYSDISGYLGKVFTLCYNSTRNTRKIFSNFSWDKYKTKYKNMTVTKIIRFPEK